jgi:hypothetical protein
MTKQEILDRIQDILNQDGQWNNQALDLLRHDLELDIMEIDQFNRESA